MKLFLRYKGIAALYNDEITFSQLLNFVIKEFHLKADTVEMSFIDEENDSIVLLSNEDLEVMQTIMESKEYVQINVEGELDSFEEASEVKVQEKTSIQFETQNSKEEVKVAEPINVQEMKKEEIIANENETCQKRERWRCGRGGWKWGRMGEFLNETVSKLVDERLKVLLPCLKEQLQNKEEKQMDNKNSLIHEEYECKGCLMKPIIGIRYQCLTCSQFNLCQICEEKIQHQHNLLKVKKIVKENQKSKLCSDFPHPHFNHWKSGQQRRCRWRNEDNFDKHSWTLAYMFGGVSQDYKEFTEKNHDLRPRELFKAYADSKNMTSEEFTQRLIAMRCKKLEMTFKKPAETYEKMVSENVDCGYHQLVRMLCRRGLEDRDNRQCWWDVARTEELALQSKAEENEEKKEEVSKLSSTKKFEEKEKSEETDKLYRDEVLAQMIDLFGVEKEKNYLSFIEENINLGKEKIIEMWITTLINKKMIG